jgi:hypothetical protein
MLISGIALLGICALSCLILALLLFNFGSDRFVNLFKRDESTPVPQVTRVISDVVNVNVNGTPVPPGVPSRLTLGSKSFDISPLFVDDNKEWKYNPNDKKAAYWSAGTLVNYIIGLHASTDNKATFEEMQSGNLITLDTGTGVQRYRVVDKTQVRADELALISTQNSPRLTLVLLGQSGEMRDVLVAQYTDEGTPNQAVAMNAPVNLGDARVTAFGQRLVSGVSAGLPANKNYFQVNIRVTNVTTRVLDATQFFAELTDGQGNKYPLSAPGSGASGASGWGAGALSPGQSISITSGFEVPASMQGPNLEWTFALDKSNPYVARVAIPYRPIFVDPTAEPTPILTTRVDIINANISPEGNELNVIGNITNLTDKPIVISLKDTSLKSGDGNFVPLNSSLPGLSWEVNAGATLTFKLAFAKPAALPATFTLMEQNYQISP